MNPLEELWAEVAPTIATKKNKARGGINTSLADLPENWSRRRGLALIHRETYTLLGHFSEYVHKHLHSEEHPCRKLIREESELFVVSEIEWVEGEPWLGYTPAAVLPSPESWTEEQEAIVDLVLPRLGLSAKAAEVQVTVLQKKFFSQILLAEATQFHSQDGSIAMFLPKHLNIMEALGLDCKLTLRAELGLDDEGEEPADA